MELMMLDLTFCKNIPGSLMIDKTKKEKIKKINTFPILLETTHT